MGFSTRVDDGMTRRELVTGLDVESGSLDVDNNADNNADNNNADNNADNNAPTAQTFARCHRHCDGLNDALRVVVLSTC